MSQEILEKRFTDLQDRLAVLQDATNELKELIDRLANFNFQPGSVPLGAGEDDNVGSELSSEINQILREQEEELELFQEEIIDIRPGKPGSELQHDKDRLKDGAQRLEQELQSCRKRFRKAQIAAKRNLQLAQRQERELLYASFARPRSGASSPAPAAPQPRRRYQARSEMSKEEQMLAANSDVTQSMRRTHDMMAAELAKSDFAHNALKESTTALSQLSEDYSSLDSMLSNSRALMGTLLKSQKSDTWYLRTAFWILASTIVWLIWRRLLWGPFWWLFFLPLKLVFRGVFGVSNAVGLTGSQVKPRLPSASTSARQAEVQMNNQGVPTIKVDQQPSQPDEARDDESLMEEVSRIVDEKHHESSPGVNMEADQADEATLARERENEDFANPKKRMMEEGAETQQWDQRVRDEL
ncbi:Sec20-domain-containing protein [Xylariomycetidae sp. FL0641]|nr:Sec20-domain-containing protein [Xylariomycetidae sp. FL0641]